MNGSDVASGGPAPDRSEPRPGEIGDERTERVRVERLAALDEPPADALGESDEAARCVQFLRDCDPAAADALVR